MSKISVTPVKKVDISICVADIGTLERKRLLMDMIDGITANFVPSGFIDPCQLNRHQDWIDIKEPLDSDQAGDFMQQIGQAYAIATAKLDSWAVSKD